MTHDTPHPATAGRQAFRRCALTALLSATTLIGATATALAAEPKPSPGRALAERQGCLGCHALDTALVGPAYQAIAERYREQPGAEATLVQHMRSGSSGRWGTMPMPPQPQLSQADARRLAKWVLSGAK